MEQVKGSLLRVTIWIGIIMTFISLFGPNPLLCLPAFVTLYFIISKLFISKYLTVFLVSFLYQWAQTSIKILYATITFTDFKLLTDFPFYIIEAYLLSCIALIVLTYGISISLKKIKLSDTEVEASLRNTNFSRVLILYFCMGMMVEVIGRIPGFFQFAVMFGGLKWGVFYLIFIYCCKEKKNKLLLYMLIIYEVCIGFFSYFADWKTVIFYVLISSLSVLNLNIRKLFGLFIGGIFVIYLALVWTGVKSDYRNFLANGGKQVVAVSGAEAYRKLFQLVSDFRITDDVEKSFLDRMSYIDYFSSCLAYVPSNTPHENGKLTLDAVKHVFMPRAFFPDKAVIDESAHLTKYTGVFYSNYSMGVSFSLGYVGDFYIDYGIFGMFIALFLFGLFIGKIFSSVFNGAKINILGVVIIASAFLLLFRFEISMLKLIGNLVVFWILYRLLEIFIFPHIVNFFINRTNE